MEFLEENWFNLTQTLGIVASFAVAVFALRWQSRQIKIANSLLINSHHREIWGHLFNDKELSRVFQKDVDLHSKPITDREHVFVNMIFLHMSACLKGIQSRAIDPVEGVENDLRNIMTYPIPRAVWHKVAKYHDHSFYEFIEKHGELPEEFWATTTLSSPH